MAILLWCKILIQKVPILHYTEANERKNLYVTVSKCQNFVKNDELKPLFLGKEGKKGKAKDRYLKNDKITISQLKDLMYVCNEIC